MSGRMVLLGGTGAIGPYAVRALAQAGHEVTALVRSEAKAELVAGLGAKPVVGTIFDTERLTELFAGHDAVVNLVTSIPSTLRYALPSAWRENARIRTDGTRSVVDAALAAEVPRLVQESIALVYRDGGSGWIDENTPLEPYSTTTSTPLSESEIERFTASGGAGLVLRFGMFYGPGSKQSAEMLSAAKLRFGPVLGHPDRYWSPICLPDAGSAVATAIDAPAGVYNVVDDEPVTKRAFADAISAAVGRRSWVRGPGRLIGLPGDQMSAITRSLRVSNAKFKNATGWSPQFPSAREGWHHTVNTISRPAP